MEKNFAKWAFWLNAGIGAAVVALLVVLIVGADNRREIEIANAVEKTAHENIFLLYNDYLGHLPYQIIHEKEKILRKRINAEMVQRFGLNILGQEDANYSTNRTAQGTNQAVDALTLGEIEQIRDIMGFKYPTRSRVVTSPFGFRNGVLPRNAGGLEEENHKGEDFGARIGTPVVAQADGFVSYAGWLRGYGWAIIVRHDQAQGRTGHVVETLIGHLSEIYVRRWDLVDAGQLIGRTGNSGRTTGAHAHAEIRIDGVAYNPDYFLMDESDN